MPSRRFQLRKRSHYLRRSKRLSRDALPPAAHRKRIGPSPAKATGTSDAPRAKLCFAFGESKFRQPRTHTLSFRRIDLKIISRGMQERHGRILRTVIEPGEGPPGSCARRRRGERWRIETSLPRVRFGRRSALGIWSNQGFDTLILVPSCRYYYRCPRQECPLKRSVIIEFMNECARRKQHGTALELVGKSGSLPLEELDRGRSS